MHATTMSPRTNYYITDKSHLPYFLKEPALKVGFSMSLSQSDNITTVEQFGIVISVGNSDLDIKQQMRKHVY